MKLPMAGWRNISYYCHSFARILIRQHCDLWIFPSQDIWSYRINIPSLVSIHDLMHRYEKRFPEVSVDGEYEERENCYKQICKWSKAILVDSKVGKEQVVESYGADCNKIYELPFVAPQYIYDSKSSDKFDKRYKLPEKFLFYPAQFWEHKNHKRLVLAVNSLVSKHPDINMVFVGSKKNGYESVFDMVCKLGLDKKIFFFGYVPNEDMPEFYRRARGMIMPTFFGPTNIPPLEANALGCPVAVSRIYAMPDQLQDAAIYFDPLSVEQMVDAIERIWTDDLLCADLKKHGLMRSGQWNQQGFNKKLYEITKDILD